MKDLRHDISVWLDEDFETLIQPSEWISIPERRLLFAILERAVRDVLGNQPEETQAAREWLLEDSLDWTPFSFGWICRELGINPSEFRAKVFRALAVKKNLPVPFISLRTSVCQPTEHQAAIGKSNQQMAQVISNGGLL